jgi:hypothetical protein
MEPSAMKFMYLRNKQANAGYAVGLYSYYSMLNRMFCLTLTLGVETGRISLTLLRSHEASSTSILIE